MVSDYRHIVEFLSDAYIVADPYTSLILDADQAAYAAFGYERQELLGRPIWDISPGLEQSTVHRIWSDLRYEETISIETSSRKKDGSDFQVLIRIGRTVHDHRPAMQFLARDITEEKRAIEMVEQLGKKADDAEGLRAQNVELARAHRMISDFLGTLSHEMNTPLTSLIAFTDILRKNKPGNLISTQKQQLELMQKCGARLDRLLSQLLDSAIIEAGTLEINLSRFDIADMVYEAVDFFAPALIDKNQSLEIQGTDASHTVEGDRDHLIQIMTNLISNASKYSPAGSHIVILIKRVKDDIHISIKDDGPGISEDDRQKIFEAFYRADNQLTRNEAGAGLGLSITKSLVEIHGGKISIESSAEGGAKVGFWLPLVKPLDDPEDQNGDEAHGDVTGQEPS